LKKLQKQGTTYFQICTTEKQIFQSSCRKAEPLWFTFCFLKAEAGSESSTKHSLNSIQKVWRTTDQMLYFGEK
jgi:hypothetical protein